MEQIEIKVGQVWQDNDPRVTYIRELTIHSISGEYAWCKMPSGKLRRIKLKRLRPTASGYRLVKDVS